MARFYMLAVQPTLFGDVSLCTPLGTDGDAWPAEKSILFNEEKDAVELFLELLREKRNAWLSSETLCPNPRPSGFPPAALHRWTKRSRKAGRGSL